MNAHILAFVDLRPDTAPPPPDEPDPDNQGIECGPPDVSNESNFVTEEPLPKDPRGGAE